MAPFIRNLPITVLQLGEDTRGGRSKFKMQLEASNALLGLFMHKFSAFVRISLSATTRERETHLVSIAALYSNNASWLLNA